LNQDRLNILFISAWYPNKTNPTLGNFVEKHVRAANLYCNTQVLHAVFVNKDNGKHLDFDYKIENNIPVLRVYINNKKYGISFIDKLIRFYSYFRAYRKGWQFLIEKHGKPDILHANILYPTGTIALLFNKIYKLPFIITEHWTGYMPNDPNKIGAIHKVVSKMVAEKASKILPVSEDLMDAMIKHNITGNYQVIPNVIDTNLFKVNPKVNNPGKFRFIHISSLDNTQKNIRGILRAVNQLSKNRKDFELLIIGDGDAEKYLQMAEEMNILNSFVKFESEKTTEEIAQALQSSDCLLMFSNYESFSVVIAEAMACGLPVIVTRVGGLANNLSPKHGIVINAVNETALTNSMNQMINNISNYNKEEIASFAEKFSFEKVGKSFFNIYNETFIRNRD